jgi:LPPG:FO 2-phospho-L-lactate transferase
VRGDHVVVLTGGVGGAKLVAGLVDLLGPGQVTAIVNTGDDFRHLGLHICPDIDTLLYTLSGLADPVRGWGRRDESWHALATLGALGGPDWFALGDRDLALHLLRTARLAAGERLTGITAALADRLGIGATILPMSDADCGVRIVTDAEKLDFQTYFVARRCAPAVRQVDLSRPRAAAAAPEAIAALGRADLAAIVIAPSNPWLSIDPILAVPGLNAALRARQVPLLAVTPLPGGRAVKGPTAKIMQELGLALSAASIADHYRGLIDGLMIDDADSDLADLPWVRTDTIMTTSADRRRVAERLIDWAARF